MDKTTALALELDPDLAHFMIAAPYPGTALWETVKRDGFDYISLSFIDKDGKIQKLESLENIQGTTTGQTISSINSSDGSIVEKEQKLIYQLASI